MDSEMPFVYDCCAKALTQLKSKKGSLRQIMDQFQVQNKAAKSIYALTTKVLKNIDVIREVIKSTGLAEQIDCDSALLEVLVGEILFGQRISDSRNQIIKVVLKNRKSVVAKFRSLKKKAEPSNEVSNLPVKYLRVNLLKASVDEIVKLLESNGYSQKIVEDDLTFKKFLELIGNIEEKTFVKDFHFPNELLVVNVKDKADIMSSDAYKEGKIIFFDKASLMAVEMLHVKRGMTVLDICGAPGMKTAAIASRCEGDLNIISLDKDWKRCKEMKKLLSTLGVESVDIRCSDFLSHDSVNDVSPDVILLDPSCSGTGMFDRLDYGEKSEDKHRCLKLAAFQTKMLCKAMSLKPKRIVYSTCSTNIIENELVIQSALKEAENGDEYELVKELQSWPKRGENKIKQCIRSDETCLTKGFFAAALKLKE